MSYRSPEYTPMCNKHLRFYLSNPERTEFQDHIAERQFRAVEKALGGFSDVELERLKDIMLSPNCSRDLTDSYISIQLRVLGFSAAEANDFYKTLHTLNKQVAISLGYIAGKRSGPIHWTANL